MKKTIALLSLFLFMVNDINQNKTINTFSNNLIKIISEKKCNKLKKIKVYPQKNTLEPQTLEYLTQNSVVELMKKKSLKIQVNKRVVKNDTIFNVIFYNSKKFSLKKNGFLDVSRSQIEKYWAKEFIATELVIIKGIVYFYNTPFFYETDL